MYRVTQQTNAFVMRALWRGGRPPSLFTVWQFITFWWEWEFSRFFQIVLLFNVIKQKKKKKINVFLLCNFSSEKRFLFLALLSWAGNGRHRRCRNSVVGAQSAVSWWCTTELSGLVLDPSSAMLSCMSRGQLLQPFKPQSLHLHSGDYNSSDLKK